MADESRVLGQMSVVEAMDALLGAEDIQPEDVKHLFDFRDQPLSKTILPRRASLEPWQHTDHAFGFVADPDEATGDSKIEDVGQISPDASLKGQSVDVRLDRLRIAKYPGRGVNKILFEFRAANDVLGGQDQPVVFSQNYRIQEGQAAGVRGFLIFRGLTVSAQGVGFKFRTVNVLNENDKKMLEVLDSPEVQGGLKLASSLNPVVPILSSYAMGFAKRALTSKENKEISEVSLGLDLVAGATGAALRKGAYVVIQVPSAANWDWSKWVISAKNGALISNEGARAEAPYNYFIFRVS